MEEAMTRIAVMGAGSWGTTFAQVCADAGSSVILWGRDPSVIDGIVRDGRNHAYLPDIDLVGIEASTDSAAVLRDAQIVVLAVPSQTLRDNLRSWKSLINPDAAVVSLIKGIEEGTTLRMSQVIEAETATPASRIVVLSGPNLAHEIAVRQPAATTVACADEQIAALVQHACAAPYFRPYRTTDVVGTEIGGATKNVIALANGMAVGLGFGESAQAALITRGLAEMTRLGMALGAVPMTFAGLAGMGDLVATCTSSLSRNRSYGVRLGSGMTVAQADEATTRTSEGVRSCRAILSLAQAHGVDMPITEQVVEVVYNGLAPKEMLKRFMARDMKPEA
jgi:glycerol-3-phosphate dehydrogenase (NAD(P)+)